MTLSGWRAHLRADRVDLSYAGVLLEAELAELLGSPVDPLSYGETSEPFTLPSTKC